MDFIEQLLGVSPDGGNGLFELLLFLVPALALAGWWLARRRRVAARR